MTFYSVRIAILAAAARQHSSLPVQRAPKKLVYFEEIYLSVIFGEGYKDIAEDSTWWEQISQDLMNKAIYQWLDRISLVIRAIGGHH